jgi:hypothetical protein
VPLVAPLLITDPILALMVVLLGNVKGFEYVPLLEAKLPSATVTLRAAGVYSG